MRVTTIGAAVAAILATSAHAAPSNVTWKAPTSGGTLSGVLNQSATCEVSGTGISYVRFYIDGRAQHRYGLAVPLQHRHHQVLERDAYAARDRVRQQQHRRDERDLDQDPATGGSTTPPPPPPPPPTEPVPPPPSGSLSFTSPASGATLKGTSNPCAVNGLSTTKYVRFYVDSTWLNTDTSNPWACNIDTTKFKDGAHTLKAVAWQTNDTGPSNTVTIPIVIANSGTTPPPPPPPDDEVPPPVSLPSTGTRAVATFESIGLYWKPPSNPGSAGCTIRYEEGQRVDLEGRPADVVRLAQQRVPRQHRAPRSGHRLPGAVRPAGQDPGRAGQHQDLVGELPDRAHGHRRQPHHAAQHHRRRHGQRLRALHRRQHRRRRRRGPQHPHLGAVRHRARPDAQGRDPRRHLAGAGHQQRGDRGQRHQRLGPFQRQDHQGRLEGRHQRGFGGEALRAAAPARG